MNETRDFKPAIGARRAFAVLPTLIGAAMALSACGGGGGSTASTPGTSVVTPGTSVVTPAVQAIQITNKSLAIDGQKDIPIGSSTTVSIDLVPANFSSSSTADYKVSGDFTVTCNGVKQSSLTGVWTVTAPGLNAFVATSSVTFTGAPYAASCTMAANVTATRGSVTSIALPITATFTTAADAILSYTEKTYALWTGAYPYAVTNTGVTPVVNKTKYTFGARPLSKCAIMDPSFTARMKGKVLTECQASDGTGRHVLYIDPSKNEIYEYSGTVPTDVVWQDVTPLDLIVLIRLSHPPTTGSMLSICANWDGHGYRCA